MRYALLANGFQDFLRRVSDFFHASYGLTAFFLLILSAVLLFVLMAATAAVGEKKNRNVIVWAAAGLLLPVLSLILVSVLPARKQDVKKARKKLKNGTYANKKKITAFNVMNTLIMVAVILISILPFWIILMAAFSENAKLSAYGISLWFRGFSVESFSYLFKNSNILHSIFISLVTSFAQCFLEMAVCALAAYALSKRDLVGRGFFNRYLMLTMFFTGGMIPSYIIVRAVGLYDTLWSMILPGIGAAYHILLIRTYFMSLPRSLEEAAELDGASTGAVFFRVYLPLSVPIIVTVGIMQFIARWNNWMNSLLYLSTKKENLWTLQYVLRKILLNAASVSSGGGDVPLISARNAGILIAVIPLIIISPVMQKYFVKGVTVGAVKG